MVKRRQWIGGVFINLANVVILVTILLPLLALLLGSVQTEADLVDNPRDPWPQAIIGDNYAAVALSQPIKQYGTVMRYTEFPDAFKNSAIIAITVTLVTLCLGTLTAYTVVRLKFRGSGPMTLMVLATRVVPTIILMVPLYVLLSRVKLLNTMPGVILCEIGFLTPYAIWILMGYFASLPSELEDAGRVDGCTRLGAFVRLLLPLATPGLAACGTIVFLFSWHDLLTPLVILKTRTVTTLPVLLVSLMTDYQTYYTILCAASVFALLPTAVLALLLRRYVVSGLLAGAMKG